MKEKRHKRVAKKRSKSQVAQGIRAKGKDYERKIAKILSGWWGSPLRRTPTSGGNIYSGDIFDPQGEFPFIVECKKRHQLSFSGLLENDSELWKFWKKALEDYIPEDPHHEPTDPPALIFSQDYDADYFMIELTWFRRLEAYCGGFSHSYLEPVFPLGYPACPEESRGVIVGKLKDFLEHFQTEIVRTIPEFRRNR